MSNRNIQRVGLKINLVIKRFLISDPFFRKSEQALKRLQKRSLKKFRKGKRQSANYKKAQQKLARKHLRVSRQRKKSREVSKMRD